MSNGGAVVFSGRKVDKNTFLCFHGGHATVTIPYTLHTGENQFSHDAELTRGQFTGEMQNTTLLSHGWYSAFL
ncbi:MAG: hypothetical protein PHE41_08465, partial [Eubacteriales bacterium]|nr:hypothetical protein [Eubacteriales bacterium]